MDAPETDHEPEMPLFKSRPFLTFLLGLAASLPSQADLPDVIAKAKPSIAAVGIYSAVSNPRFGFRGTGFVVGDGNVLITNAHVLPDLDKGGGNSSLAVYIRASAGQLELRPVSIAALDRPHDLALLRFEGSPIPALPIAPAAGIREGLSVAVIGFPVGGVLGFTPVTHRGIISSITAVALPVPDSQHLSARAARQLREGSFDIYQLDATAYPGNSGGPVLDADTGAVVGVINMVLVKGTKESALSHPTGISYAIPARFVEELMRR